MSLSRLLLFVVGSIYLHSPKIHALRPVEKSLFVVFGRPGSGKTTVANEAFGVLSHTLKNRDDRNIECVALDLDVCVTQVMRDNFGKGMYPTLEERKVFAIDACDYVEEQLTKICQRKDETPDSICAIISFSFVNTDLREIFRERFPHAEWILIDTNEEECTKRINEREGHFYKGEIVSDDKTSDTSDDASSTKDDDETNNSDWKFAPVAFPHVVLDGFNAVEDSAKMVVEKILQNI
jgi:gluconate kinase